MLIIRHENIFITIIKLVLTKVSPNIDNDGNCNIYSNGEESFIRKYFSEQKKGNPFIAFDIGANVGDYSEILITNAEKFNLNYKIHAFEPIPICFKELQRKLKNNNRILVNNFGISEINGEKDIFFNKNETGHASLYNRNLQNNQHPEHSEVISLRRLDNYITEKKIVHINFIKIDVEGHELSVLKSLGINLNSKFIDAIQFEYGGTFKDSQTKLSDIYYLLENSGFILHKIMKNNIQKRNFTRIMENYQYSNYVAISREFLNDRTKAK